MQYELGGGTSRGISYYKTVLKCARKAILDEKVRSETELVSLGSGALAVGSLFHAFMELHYRDNLSEFQGVEFVGKSVDEKAVIEALRLAYAYTDHFKGERLGKVIEVESEYPVDNYQAGIICGAVGIEPYTFKLDMVVKLTKADCKRFEKTRDLVLEPGYYLWDHKTERGRSQTMVDRFMNSLQFTAYQIAWQAINPKLKLKGLLVNIIFKTKVPGFFTLHVPYPRRSQVKVLDSFFQTVQRVLDDDWLKQAPNPEACFFPGLCSHFVSDRCSRF